MKLILPDLWQALTLASQPDSLPPWQTARKLTGREFKAHSAPATRLRVTVDDQYLFSTGEVPSPRTPAPGPLKFDLLIGLPRDVVALCAGLPRPHSSPALAPRKVSGDFETVARRALLTPAARCC